MDEQQRRLAEELLFTGEHKPSFAKMLYFGLLDTSRVFPYPQIASQEKKISDEFVEKVKQFAKTQINPDEIDRNSNIPESVIRGLGDLGLLGMTIPKEYGGLGMSQYAYCRAMEELSKRCSSTALFVNAHQSVGLKALLLFGTEEQRKRWLEPVAKGKELAAFSLTEPNAGSDAAGIETRAVFIPEKNCYRINGKKQWTTNGSIAKILTVMARTEVDTPRGKEDKITAFLVTPDMPGFEVTSAALEKVGMRGSVTSNLAFHDLEVPAENILGPMGGGLRVCLTVLDYGRTTFGATCTGTAKVLLEKAIYHAKNRYQFKKPLASFPLVKKKLATIACLVYAMDATTYLTAGLLDSGEKDIMLEASILKVFASESLWKIIYETMQIFGGRSFFTDEPLERMMRDGRLNMIGEGANEVLRAFIGVVGMRDVGVQLKEVLDALKNPMGEFDTLKRFAKTFLYKLHAPTVPVRSSVLQPEAKRLGSAIRKFGFSVAKLLAMYREDILEQQLLLDRIATSAISIYTTTAVLSKLDSELTAKTAGPNDVPIAKLYCQQSLDMLNRSLNSLSSNRDKDIEKVSDLL
jgi:alkylation response protein AidB-like acyl-CoA dehydrogenase